MTVEPSGAKSMMFIIKLKITQLFRFIGQAISNWIETNVLSPIRKTVSKVVHSKPFIGILMLVIGATWTWSVTYSSYEGAEIMRFARGEVASFIKPSEPIVYVNHVHAKTVEPKEEAQAPKVEDAKAQKIGEFSAYNAEKSQTDSNPFVMASGKRVYAGAVANNCLPFGAKIEVNGNLYTVEDRMNKRYGCDHFDFFMWEKTEALKFGRQQLAYQVVGD